MSFVQTDNIHWNIFFKISTVTKFWAGSLVIFFRLPYGQKYADSFKLIDLHGIELGEISKISIEAVSF